MACDLQQCGIPTRADLDEPAQPPPPPRLRTQTTPVYVGVPAQVLADGHVDDFSNRNLSLTAKLSKRGYRYPNIRKVCHLDN